jgi:hypothetical protein
VPSWSDRAAFSIAEDEQSPSLLWHTEIAAAGQHVVRTASPVVIEQTLSPVSYWIGARVPVEIYAAGADAAVRAAHLEALLAGLSAAVLADRTLAGVVADAEPVFDGEETLPADGGETVAGVALAIRCQYELEGPLG